MKKTVPWENYTPWRKSLKIKNIVWKTLEKDTPAVKEKENRENKKTRKAEKLKGKVQLSKRT